MVGKLTFISRENTAFARIAKEEKSFFFISLTEQLNLSRDVSMAMILGTGAL